MKNIHRYIIFWAPFIFLIAELTAVQFFSIQLAKEVQIIAMAVWMVTWWIFSIAPLGATALIPLVYLPLHQLLQVKEITPYYSDPMIFLFLGGFIIARGLEKTELSERFALNVLKVTGHSDAGIVGGFIISTALLSMWISNTATAIMMIPIAQSVLTFLEKNTEHSEADIKNFRTVIYLSIAYAANIGGTMTPIGTPPNVLLVGFLQNFYQVKIDFWKWMAIMVPVSVLFLFAQFLILNKLFRYKIGISDEFRVFLNKAIKNLKPFNHSQKLAIGIFVLSCLLWIFKDLINYGLNFKLLDDTTIAMFGGVAFFVIPYNFKNLRMILDTSDIPALPWDIILLFGGGMAMAGSLEKFGLIESIVSMFVEVPSTSPYMLVLLLATLTLILTEIMSNVALCMIALPLIMGLGISKGIDPVLIGLPSAICASYAFSLPISTPPNAIVFGSNKIQVKDMLRAGIIMNILGVFSVMTLGWFLMKTLL